MTTSFWAQALRSTGHPLERRLTTEVAVVGAGMSGLAAAYYLAARNVPCVVLERNSMASGASSRNAGMVITGLGEHYARSIIKFGRDRARSIWEINRANQGLMREVVQTEGIDCQYCRTGSFALAWDDAEARDLEASLGVLQEDGFSAELMDEEAIQSALQVEGCSRALYSPEDAQLHPVRLIEGLGGRLDSIGVAIFEDTPVLHIQPGSGLRTEILLTTPKASVTCKKVIVAANAYTPGLVPRYSGLIQPVRGQCLAATTEDGSRFPGPCYADRGNVYWRGAGSRLILGGFEQLSGDSAGGDSTTGVVQERIEQFARTRAPSPGIGGPLLPWGLGLKRLGVTHRWSGLMGFTPDWFPLIGETERGSGVYLAAAFAGHGFGYAFQAAKWVVESLHGEEAAIPGFLHCRRGFEGAQEEVL